MREIITDKDVLIEGIRNNITIMNNASDELKNNKEVILEILKTNPSYVRYYIGESLKNDSEFMSGIDRTLNYYCNNSLKSQYIDAMNAYISDGNSYYAYLIEEVYSENLEKLPELIRDVEKMKAEIDTLDEFDKIILELKEYDIKYMKWLETDRNLDEKEKTHSVSEIGKLKNVTIKEMKAVINETEREFKKSQDRKEMEIPEN